jgi:hypothetical protein
MAWKPSEREPDPERVFYSSVAMPFAMHDFVFRGRESVPIGIAEKRIEKWRKKHPEDFACLEKMKEVVYPEGLEPSDDFKMEHQPRRAMISSFSDSAGSPGMPKETSRSISDRFKKIL